MTTSYEVGDFGLVAGAHNGRSELDSTSLTDRAAHVSGSVDEGTLAVWVVPLWEFGSASEESNVGVTAWIEFGAGAGLVAEGLTGTTPWPGVRLITDSGR